MPTDIAARGLDVAGLSHVANFEVPKLPEDYIHRVGRTERMKAMGDAITLVSPAEDANLRMVERAVGTRIRRVTLPDFDYTRLLPRNASRSRGGSASAAIRVGKTAPPVIVL